MHQRPIPKPGEELPPHRQPLALSVPVPPDGGQGDAHARRRAQAQANAGRSAGHWPEFRIRGTGPDVAQDPGALVRQAGKRRTRRRGEKQGKGLEKRESAVASVAVTLVLQQLQSESVAAGAPRGEVLVERPGGWTGGSALGGSALGGSAPGGSAPGGSALGGSASGHVLL